MPPVELPGVVRVVLEWSRAGDDQIVQTFHCQRQGTEDQGTLNVLAKDLGTWLAGASNPWRQAMSQVSILNRIIAYDLHPGANVAGEEQVDLQGLGSSTQLPHQVAAVVTWTTPFRGASFRGRTFVGPLPNTAVDAQGRLATAYRNSLGGAAGALVGAFAGTGRLMVVPSYVRNSSTVITGFRIDDSPDVIRKRARRPVQATVVAVTP